MRPLTCPGILASVVACVFLFAAAPTKPVAVSQTSSDLSFKLDPVHCMVNFRVQHMGAGMFWGRFNDVNGTMTTSEDGTGAPSFEVTVSTESIDTGTEKLDRTLMGPNFFDSKEFPSISFKSTKAEAAGEGKWKVTGDLTLLAITKSITVEVEFTGLVGNPVMKKVGYESVFTINRSDYGMNWGVDNGALGNEVRLVVSLEGDWSA